MFQIASLPIVILAPLGAVSLLWNAFFACFILGDVFSLWMILGTLLIAGGAVLIAIFGIVPEPTHSLEDLLILFSRPAFVAYFTLLGFAVLVCLAIVSSVLYHTGVSLMDYPDTHRRVLILTPPSEPASIPTIVTPYDPHQLQRRPNYRAYTTARSQTRFFLSSINRFRHKLCNAEEHPDFTHAAPPLYILRFHVWHSVRDVSCLRKVGRRAPAHQHPREQSVLEMASLDARPRPCWVRPSSALVSE